MSVQRNDIVIIGQRFSYKTYQSWDEKKRDEFYNKYCESAYDFDKYAVKPKPWDGQLTCVFDGMNGEYIIVGYILNSTQAEEWNGMENIEYTEADINAYFLLVKEALAKTDLQKLFGVGPMIRLHTFSHFS